MILYNINMTAEELEKKMPQSEKDEMDQVVKLIAKDYGKTILKLAKT